MNSKKNVFSCVLDFSPSMAVQTYIWLSNLLDIGIHPKNIFVHIVGKLSYEFEEFLKSKSLNIIYCEPFDSRNKYCNKLVQLETFQSIQNYDYVFLMDCDTAIVSLEKLELKEDVYAKIVDFPNPPIEILKAIYKKAGQSFIETLTSFPLNNNNQTEFNNCNGGLYVFSNKALNTIAPYWIKWSKWCIENADLFTKEYDKHADQVGFALAMSETKTKLSHLDITWNYPTHVNKNSLPNVKPSIIHFHQELTKNNKLKYKGLKNVDLAIHDINNTLDEIQFEHPRDIKPKELNEAYLQVERPDLLQNLVDVSRMNFGFYTSHYPRVFEYTWLLTELESITQKEILDIGAGVCPLPICLQDSGNEVTTVDYHESIRNVENKEPWNEWGFLDYSMISDSIKSYNVDFSKFRTSKRFDYIYSISVIEHMPSNIRRKVLKKTSTLLKLNGELLLTIDLIPNTNDLWNFSEGMEVESVQKHGTIETLRNELQSIGFEILSEEIQRGIMNSRTDILYLKAKLVKKSFLKRFLSR